MGAAVNHDYLEILKDIVEKIITKALSEVHILLQRYR